MASRIGDGPNRAGKQVGEHTRGAVRKRRRLLAPLTVPAAVVTLLADRDRVPKPFMNRGDVGEASAGGDNGEGCSRFAAKEEQPGVRLCGLLLLLFVGVEVAEYFASHAKPSTPRDVLNHRCINLRGGSARAYRWEFEKDGESVEVDVTGPMIFDDAHLMIRARSRAWV